MRTRIAAALASIVVVAAGACGDDDGPGGAGGSGGAPPAVCDAHAVAAPPLFSDATTAWGLGAITGQVSVQIVAAADLDTDGYPDLVVHGYGGRMQIGQPAHVKVLMNVPRDGGGRRFVDRTADSGYPGVADGSKTEYRAAHMAAFADVDNDGDLDAFSGTYNDPFTADTADPAYAEDRSAVLLNDGAGRFSPAPPSDVQSGPPVAVSGISLADVNLDGRIDAFLAIWYSRTGAERTQPLFYGNGDGTFTDVTDQVGLGASELRRPGFGATICDVDDSGIPDLMTQSYGRRPNLLFVGQPTGAFVDVGVPSGYAYDGDATFAGDQSFLCWCASNAADPRCAGAAAPSVLCSGVPPWVWGESDQPDNLGGNTFSTACGDVDGDGKLDLYTGEIAHWWAGSGSDKSNLAYNRSDAAGVRFERADREAKGLDWEHTSASWDEGGLYTTMADLDNDGRLDILVGASDYGDQWLMVFHQKPDGTFEEVAKGWGISHACASSPVVADFDRDGDLDVVTGSSLWRTFCNESWGGDSMTTGTPEVRFYENDASVAGRWLAVRLVGDGATTNRSAVGARVTVNAGGVAQVRELGAGHGHFAMQDDTVLFFGVGDCTEAASVEVTWPDLSRSRQRFERVETGRLVEIRQGEGEIR